MTNTVFRPQVLAVVIFAALVAQGFPASPAVARTSIQVNVGIGGPVFEGLSEPDVVVLPGTRSYYVPGYADADVARRHLPVLRVRVAPFATGNLLYTRPALSNCPEEMMAPFDDGAL